MTDNPLSCLSLSLSLCLSWSFCLSSPFQQALSSLSFLPRGLSSFSFLSDIHHPFIFLPLLFLLTLIFPISLSVHHVLSAQWPWQLGGCRDWTRTYVHPLSNTPKVGRAEAELRVALVSLQQREECCLTVRLGNLAGFTGLHREDMTTISLQENPKAD